MKKRKPRIGRPPGPNANGYTYRFKRIPRREWTQFRALCRKSHLTAHDGLVRLLKAAVATKAFPPESP